MIRWNSAYYDPETSWYYYGKSYYDTVGNRHISGTDGAIEQIEELFTKHSVYAMDVVSTMYYSLLNDSNYGKAISYSKNWYSGLSEVELIARMIYGENTSVTNDQRAIGWVLKNRMVEGGYGGDTFEEIITCTVPAVQFEAICGNELATVEARNAKDTSNKGWQTATFIACTLKCVTNESDIQTYFNKPLGIDTQTFFASYNNFVAYVSMNSVTDVAIAGKGTYTTMAAVKAAGYKGINIFYNYN